MLPFVYLSVTTLAATYLVFKSQIKCHEVLYGVFNGCIVWIFLKKTLYSRVLALLPSSMYISDEISTVSTNSNGLFQDKKYVFSAAGPISLPKIERLPLIALASTLCGILLTHES